jgi:hypothetical protein
MQLRRQPVQIETDRHRIIGTMHLPEVGHRSRVTDYLNADDGDFVPMTDVEITPLEGIAGEVTSYRFLVVSKRHVVTVAELDN